MRVTAIDLPDSFNLVVFLKCCREGDGDILVCHDSHEQNFGLEFDDTIEGQVAKLITKTIKQFW